MPRNSPILTLRLAIATVVALSSTIRGRAAACVQTQDSLEAHIDRC
jgi:hypothetical protein